MAMNQMTYNDKRRIFLDGAIETIIAKRLTLSNLSGGFGIDRIMQELFKDGRVPVTSFYGYIELEYGKPDSEEDIEYKLVQIIAGLNILSCHTFVANDEYGYNKISYNSFKENILRTIEKWIPEYSISVNDGWIEKYEATETTAIINNLGDLSETIADPISELLKPMKEENELIGLISKVYKEIEKIPSELTSHLNETDKSLLNKAQNLAKMEVNVVDGAKGHKGNSSLTVKDISHNFALNASLVQKLLNSK